jgi:preprotein translocase subunit SecE
LPGKKAEEANPFKQMTHGLAALGSHMGRLQKKKGSQSKKKKKQKSDQSAGASPAKANEQSDVKQAAGGMASDSRIAKSAAVGAKKTAVSAPAAVPKPKENTFTKALQFLREVKVELKKVTWPSRKQTIGSTIVVIALVMIIALFLGVVDMGLSSLIRVVLQ